MTNQQTIPPVGSRWIVNYGYDTYIVVVLSSSDYNLAWKVESGYYSYLSVAESLEKFFDLSSRCAVPLPPLPSFWEKVSNFFKRQHD